jgi:hypothetical protein
VLPEPLGGRLGLVLVGGQQLRTQDRANPVESVNGHAEEWDDRTHADK